MSDNKSTSTIFSKDNPIMELSSKQNIVQTNNVVPPIKPKEKSEK